MVCEAEALNRVFIQLGPLPIYWYGVIIASGIFLGLYLATREAERLHIHKDTIIDLVVIAAPIAIITARIYYVIFEWEQYRHGSFLQMIAIWEGGIAIHGALIGAVITAIIYARIKKISFWQIADIMAPSIILGQAIGRWGNFMNQEAHGGPVSETAYQSFVQYLPSFINNQMCINGVLYHPTFLYESIWNLIVFFILILIIKKKNPLRGEMFLSYIILYSVGRLFIEGLRTDSLILFGAIRQAQVLSVALIIGSLIILLIRRFKLQITEPYETEPPQATKKKTKKSKKK